MARITVEDCLSKVKNRFELVLLAAKRAKDIENGAQVSVPRNNDKPTLIALREIADDAVDIESLKSLTKKSLINDIPTDIPTEFEEPDVVIEDKFEDDEDDEFEDDALASDEANSSANESVTDESVTDSSESDDVDE